MQVQPYLMFDGRCEEAVPDQAACAGVAPEKVMHACLRIGETAVMASDGPCQGKPRFDGFSLAITAADDEDARRRFAALADGGEVQMPLAKTFFASSFGMVADRFGVSWMIVANAS
jgi:PhnB protein